MLLRTRMESNRLPCKWGGKFFSCIGLMRFDAVLLATMAVSDEFAAEKIFAADGKLPMNGKLLPCATVAGGYDLGNPTRCISPSVLVTADSSSCLRGQPPCKLLSPGARSNERKG